MNVEQSIIDRRDFYINYIKKLVQKIKYINIKEDQANDILMDVYLLIVDNKIKCQDPMLYILRTIRLQLINKSEFISKRYFNQKFERLNGQDVVSNEIDYIYQYQDDEVVRVRLNEIFNMLNDIYWFDREIFILYYQTTISLRQISKNTKIPYPSIFLSIKNVKNQLKLNDFDEKCLKFNKKLIKQKMKSSLLNKNK